MHESDNIQNVSGIFPEYGATVIVENESGQLFKTHLVELSQGSVEWADDVGKVVKWFNYD